MTALEQAKKLDAADPLAELRDRFVMPEGVIYLDGNSLGAAPKTAAETMRDAVERQWADDLIRSWNSNDWIGAPQRVGAKIAPLLGVAKDEVIAADSVSVNLFKMLGAICEMRVNDTVILTEAGNFPTDVHVGDGLSKSLNKKIKISPREDILSHLDENVAVLLLTHVHYKTGARYDMAAVNKAAAAKGVPVLWDLSHSVGAVPLDLHRTSTQYAVGCGYKYLNGGPGAPAFLYVAKDKQAAMRSPLQGWMGHAKPFDFEDEYRPADGMDRWLVGTPPILSMLALESGLDAWENVDMRAIWQKSVALFHFFREQMAQHCPEFTCITPTEPDQRGSHISFAHEHAWPINNALIAKNVIGDFRTPDVLRFGLTPLYTRFVDVARAVEILAGIINSGEWREERFAVGGKVT